MIPARERRERLISTFNGWPRHAAMKAFRSIVDRRHGYMNETAFLQYLPDDMVEAIARELATDDRARQRHNQRERKRAAERERALLVGLGLEAAQ